ALLSRRQLPGTVPLFRRTYQQPVRCSRVSKPTSPRRPIVTDLFTAPCAVLCTPTPAEKRSMRGTAHGSYTRCCSKQTTCRNGRVESFCVIRCMHDGESRSVALCVRRFSEIRA